MKSPIPMNANRGAKPQPHQDRDADWLWGACFEAFYDCKRQQNAEARVRSRKRQSEKPRQQLMNMGVGGPPPVVSDASHQHRRKHELINDRMTKGFQWPGGSFAGNLRYVHSAFAMRGLISDQHPTLKHFVSKLRKAKHLYIGDTKGEHYPIDSKLLALDAAYVEDNRVMCGVVRIEVDATLSAPAILDACRKSGVPFPNIVVGWQGGGGNYVNPHLIWLLHDSLPLGTGPRNRFRSLYRGVLRGLTKALISTGADPGGLMNSHRHKNPLCPLWDRTILAEQPYELAFIAKQVDITVRMSELERMAVARCAGLTWRPVPDHPLAEVAIGSNRFFHDLATWARKAVVQHRAVGGDEHLFADAVAARARRMVLDLSGDPVQHGDTALATAARVADWTWNIYRAPKREVKLSAQEITKRESDGARQTASKRRAKTQAIIIAAATKLYPQGGKMPTQAAVLAAVQAAGIRSEKTVRGYWPAVLAAMATGNLPPPYVKKDDADGLGCPMSPPSPSDAREPSPNQEMPRTSHDHGGGILLAEIVRLQKRNDEAECGERGHEIHKTSCTSQAAVPSSSGLIKPARPNKAAGRSEQLPIKPADPGLGINRTCVAGAGSYGDTS